MKELLNSMVFLLCLGAAPAFCAPAFQPTKPVRFIVPFPPGGGTDGFARNLGNKLTEMWHQQVVVENRSGAQGSIGTAHAAKAAPDGYTLLLVHQGVFTVNPHIYKDTGFDPFKDFIPVGRTTQQPFVLVANPSLPVTSLKDLVALAKSKPGKLTYGSSSSGPELAMELFKYTTGTDILHVGYKGAAPGVMDALAGTIDLMVANPASISAHVKVGKLHALVLFGNDPLSDVLPGTPTAKEAGYPTLGDMPEWYGVAVPAHTPQNIVDELNKDINFALSDAGVQKRIRALGSLPSPSTPTEFANQIRREYDRWGEMVKQAGLKAD